MCALQAVLMKLLLRSAVGTTGSQELSHHGILLHSGVETQADWSCHTCTPNKTVTLAARKMVRERSRN